MSKESVEYYLSKLENYRSQDLDLSRSAMATELGIPLETYRNWYRRTEKRSNPSSRYVKWVKSFLRARDIISATRWIHQDGPDFLNKIGIKKGQAVMDFGSGNGDYTLILAGIVGEEGKVYAIDKNQEALGELMGRVHGEGFENIEDVLVKGVETPTKIPLPDKSIDAAWFCDVLHDGYFKQDGQKEQLLRDVRRALKEDGFIAVHPVHMEKERLKRIITNTGFYLEEEYQEVVLFHGNEFHEGQIFKFKKDTEYDERPLVQHRSKLSDSRSSRFAGKPPNSGTSSCALGSDSESCRDRFGRVTAVEQCLIRSGSGCHCSLTPWQINQYQKGPMLA